MDCSAYDLKHRETAREDRTIGTALDQAARVYAHGTYDIEVDTSAVSAEACAHQIQTYLYQNPLQPRAPSTDCGTNTRPGGARSDRSRISSTRRVSIARWMRGQIPAGVTADIFSSDSLRARRTAEQISNAIGSAVILDRRLREKSYGTAEGRPQRWLGERFIPPPAAGDRLTTADEWEHVVRGDDPDDGLIFICRFVPLPLGQSLADHQDAWLELIDKRFATTRARDTND